MPLVLSEELYYCGQSSNNLIQSWPLKIAKNASFKHILKLSDDAGGVNDAASDGVGGVSDGVCDGVSGVSDSISSVSDGLSGISDGARDGVSDGVLT